MISLKLLESCFQENVTLYVSTLKNLGTFYIQCSRYMVYRKKTVVAVALTASVKLIQHSACTCVSSGDVITYF